MSKRRQTVHLEDTGVVVEGKKGTPPKKISITDFLDGCQTLYRKEIDNSRIREEEASKDPFLLPPNTYLFNMHGNKLEVGMYYRERIAPKLKHYNGRGSSSGTTYKNCAMPNIIVSLLLEKTEDKRDPRIQYKYKKARFYATDKGVLSLPGQLLMAPDNSEHLWVLPTPNMYPEGRMCYGRNSLITTFSKDLRSLHYFYKMIAESTFNNDLPLRSVSGYSCADWIDYLSGKDKFPYEKLSGFNADKHKENQQALQVAEAV